MPVAVVIYKATARTPSMRVIAHACNLCYVGEGAIAIVAIKHVLPPSGNEDVFEAIIVVVADANAAAPAVMYESRLLSDVGKAAITIVVVEAVCRGWRTWPNGVAGKDEYVHPPIIVIVDKGAAAADRLH